MHRKDGGERVYCTVMAGILIWKAMSRTVKQQIALLWNCIWEYKNEEVFEYLNKATEELHNDNPFIIAMCSKAHLKNNAPLKCSAIFTYYYIFSYRFMKGPILYKILFTNIFGRKNVSRMSMNSPGM